MKTIKNFKSFISKADLVNNKHKEIKINFLKNNFKKNIFSFYTKFIFSGVHLGHKSLRLTNAWHPSVSKFLIGNRSKTAILKIEETLASFLKAFYVITLIIKSGGYILIVNTKPEFSGILHHTKKSIKSPYIFFSDCSWVGGTLTNWSVVSQSIHIFAKFYHGFDSFLVENNINFPRYKKMKKNFKGFLTLNKKPSLKCLEHSEKFKQKVDTQNALNTNWKPDLIFLLDSTESENIIKEAFNLRIPVVAFTDSNANISHITYSIPTNTNSFFLIWFCLNWMTKVINKYHNNNLSKNKI